MLFYFCIIYQFLSLYVIAIKNAHEALEYLENLDASSEDDLSDDEDFISSGRLVILPPNNEGNEDSDSGFDKETMKTEEMKMSFSQATI